MLGDAGDVGDAGVAGDAMYIVLSVINLYEGL